jgi:outer membrane protein
VKRFSSKVVLWAIAAGAVLLTLPAWAAESKIAIVDFQKLGEESPQGKAVADAMRSEFAPRQRTLEAQQQSLKTKYDKLQKDGATMSEDQRNRAEKELRDLQRDFERARGEFQDDVSARRNEEMSRLQRMLIDEVRTYAKSQGYDLVLSAEVVVFAGQTYDITPAILTAMQAKGPASPARQPAAPMPKPQPK